MFFIIWVEALLYKCILLYNFYPEQARAYDKYFGETLDRAGDTESAEEFVAENLLRLDVYYDNLDEKHITESKQYDVSASMFCVTNYLCILKGMDKFHVQPNVLQSIIDIWMEICRQSKLNLMR